MSEPVSEQESFEFPPAMVETIIHNASIEVRKIPIAPGEEMTLLRFHTPGIVYTVKLDDRGAEIVANNLKGTKGTPGLVIAQPGDVPGLVR